MVIGLFSSSANIGNLCGSAVFAVIVLGLDGGWQATVLTTAVIMGIAACFFAAFVEEKPVGPYKAAVDEEDGIAD
jgi:predicted MFS family arabinose efflux permease